MEGPAFKDIFFAFLILVLNMTVLFIKLKKNDIQVYKYKKQKGAGVKNNYKRYSSQSLWVQIVIIPFYPANIALFNKSWIGDKVCNKY